MTAEQPASHLPERALRAFEKLAGTDWETGVSLTELLKRVNRVAAHLTSEDGTQDSRVKRTFTERSFRHYATLGCIEPPEKAGRRSVYRFRHFVQGLLVRKLLWQRMSSEQIVSLMTGRGADELKRMLLDGVEMVVKGDEDRDGPQPPDLSVGETWRRVQIVSGVELHVRSGLPRFKSAELRLVLAKVEEALTARGQ